MRGCDSDVSYPSNIYYCLHIAHTLYSRKASSRKGISPSKLAPIVHCAIQTYRKKENAIGSRKISCLCLLEQSTAFDTIDHNILLTRLSSWFSIHGTALIWFRSYLSSCCFRVKCNNDFSSSHTCLCGITQGSVLGPLFVMYTTPLSTLVSSLSLNHHLQRSVCHKN